MSIVGFVPGPGSAERIVSWVRSSNSGEQIAFLCLDKWGKKETEEAVIEALDGTDAAIITVDSAAPIASVVQYCIKNQARILISSYFELPSQPEQNAIALAKAAPCQAVVTIQGSKPVAAINKALIIVDGTPNDHALLDIVKRRQNITVTIAVIEENTGPEAEAVGQHELSRILHDAQLTDRENVTGIVIVDDDPVRGILRCHDDHDIVFVGFHQEQHVRSLGNLLGDTVIAVAKRTPPLRRRALPEWVPRINPSDYAELVQDLRAGSRWRSDFVVMLGAASAIASLGLLQNSPAVVIGSMLLAPLMTPMIGLGLSLVQGNLRLTRVCGQAIGLGILLTLGVSFAVGSVVPIGELLSSETVSRGAPNILDMMIALFAAIAASFALARPGVAGAVAGVAIATALVPPLCSVGISLAYAQWINAFGAAALFVTNLIAIIVAASITFAIMGVTGVRAKKTHRRVLRLVFTCLVTSLVILSVPLGGALADRIDEGNQRPLGFPVKRSVARAVQARVEKESGARVMFMARASVMEGVIIYVASDVDLPPKLADDLTKIVRDLMNDSELSVMVFAVRLAWKQG